MTSTGVQTRADIAESDKWDLRRLFVDVSKWQEDFAWVQQTYPRLRDWKGRVGETAKSLANCLEFEKALELKVNQANALMAWLHAGGHLIVGIEQPGHVNGNPWLRNLLPCEITGMTTTTARGVIQDWLRQPPAKPSFAESIRPVTSPADATAETSRSTGRPP